MEPELRLAFKDYEVEQLAMTEHERWLHGLNADGWTRGPVRDDENRKHPDLGNWDRMPFQRPEPEAYMAAAILTLERAGGRLGRAAGARVRRHGRRRGARPRTGDEGARAVAARLPEGLR